MNNNWDQHITNVIKKAKQRFYMLQKQGVQWKQLDPLSCIHLIKTIISPILHYGVEIMDLNKKQTTQIDKTIANMLKRALNLSTFTPTNWILWETNHQNTTEITSQRKLIFWRKILKRNDGNIQKQIITNTNSKFGNTIEHLKNTHKLQYTESIGPYTWKRQVKETTNKMRIQTLDKEKEKMEPHIIPYLDIKNHKEINPYLLHPDNFEHNEMDILNTILH